MVDCNGEVHKTRRCRGVTYPESHITKNTTYTQIKANVFATMYGVPSPLDSGAPSRGPAPAVGNKSGLQPDSSWLQPAVGNRGIRLPTKWKERSVDSSYEVESPGTPMSLEDEGDLSWYTTGAAGKTQGWRQPGCCKKQQGFAQKEQGVAKPSYAPVGYGQLSPPKNHL